MRIVSIILRTGIGGHTRSAVALSKALAARGHDVHLVANHDANLAVVRTADLPIHLVREESGFPSLSLWRTLAKLHEESPLDVVTSFHARGCIEASWFCRLHQVRMTYTIPGGPGPRDILRAPRIHVFSEELKQELEQYRRVVPPGTCEVIPARIDLEETRRVVFSTPEHELQDFVTRRGLRSHVPIVLRIATLHPNYERSIIEPIAACRRLNSRGVPVSFVHIGQVHDKATAERVNRAVAIANREADRTIAVTIQDDCEQAARWVRISSICIGAGRSAFEAMIAARPVLVVGTHGFAGVVSEDSVGDLAFFNFAGRNVPSPIPEQRSIQCLESVLEELVADDVRRMQLAKFGEQWIINNRDVRQGASAYEQSWSGMDSDSCVPIVAALEYTSRVWGRAGLAKIRQWGVRNLK